MTTPSLLRRVALAAVAVLALTIGVTAPAGAATPGHAKAVTAGDFADPGFAKFGSFYYIYKTGEGFGVKTSVSPSKGYEPKDSDQVVSSMPKRPKWVVKPKSEIAPKLWAPHVFATMRGGKPLYVMYFTGLSERRGVNCVGVATSRSPDRDFKARKRATVCAAKEKYEAIDPSAYLAKDGKRYLLYKVNYRNESGFDIRAIQMDSATGTARVKGVPSRSKIAPGARMEAPSAISHGGKVWIFTSRGNYADCSYSTDVWSAPTLWTGKFTRVKSIMSRGSTGLCGPGGATVLEDGAKTRIAFHAYVDRDGNGVKDSTVRRSWVGVLKWNSKGEPYLH